MDLGRRKKGGEHRTEQNREDGAADSGTAAVSSYWGNAERAHTATAERCMGLL